MKNSKMRALAVAVATVTSFSLAAPAVSAVEINYVDAQGELCKVTFTERERANFARIQVEAAKELIATYEANKANLMPAQREFIDAQSKLDAGFYAESYAGQPLSEAERAALDARAAGAEADWFTWVDADKASREQFRYSLRPLAQNLGMAQFSVAAQDNTQALYEAFVENKGNGSRTGDSYAFGPINKNFSASDELGMYHAVGLPETWSFRPDEKIVSAVETFQVALHVPHLLAAQYACAEYAESFTEDHPLAGELERDKSALAAGTDSGNDEYNQAVVRVPKIEALIAQGTVPQGTPGYFTSADLADEVTVDLASQPDPVPSLPGSSIDGLDKIVGIIAAIVSAFGLLAALIPGLSQLVNVGR